MRDHFVKISELEKSNPDFYRQYMSSFEKENTPREYIISYIDRKYKDNFKKLSFKERNDILEFIIIKLVMLFN